MPQITLTATADATLDANNPTTNQGTGNNSVGEYGAGAQVNRMLMEFDFSSLSGRTITSAILKLYDTGADYSSASGAIEVYRVKRDWGELTTTWNKYDGTNDWGTAGCANTTSDREAAAIGTSASIDATETLGEEYTITLDASKITEMCNGTFTNNGFLLKTTAETNDMHNICAKDHATAAYRPILVVDYSTGGALFFAQY